MHARRPVVGAGGVSPQVSLASAFAAEGGLQGRGTQGGVTASPSPHAEGAPSEAGSTGRTSRPPGRRPSLLSVLKCARKNLGPTDLRPAGRAGLR